MDAEEGGRDGGVVVLSVFAVAIHCHRRSCHVVEQNRGVPQIAFSTNAAAHRHGTIRAGPPARRKIDEID